MRNITIVFGLVILFCQQLVAQTSIKILTEKKGVSIRGLAVPLNNVIWASGSKGSIAKSVNGGESFEWSQVKGFETRDFRAIHAWDENEALIVAVAAPAVILKTIDGGKNWTKVYENADTSMFLDAIAFKDKHTGYVIGDPINDTLFLLETKDRGAHWNKVPSSFWKSKLKEGEAFFASSNSNIGFMNKTTAFVSGGKTSRIWMDGTAIPLPIMQGGKSTGANSLAVSPDANHFIIVGGDFMKDTIATNTACAFIKIDNAFRLNPAFTMPHGYRSSAEFIDNDMVVACGTSGVDYSSNRGKTWEFISNQSFHVVKHQPNSKAVFLAGSGGRIGYFVHQ